MLSSTRARHLTIAVAILAGIAAAVAPHLISRVSPPRDEPITIGPAVGMPGGPPTSSEGLRQRITEMEDRIRREPRDIGAAVQKLVEANGFSVVREFVGHGIGTRLHEEPQVPNFGVRGHGTRLREGMVLAIEPMVNVGKPEARVLDDKWTAVTVDGSFSAHFEHCVAVTRNGPMVLTE